MVQQKHFSRFDLDFREWIVEIEWYSYWHAMYAVMLSMVCVAIVSILGIFGVVEVRIDNI